MAKNAYKWDLSGKDNCEILDLLDGLRQAGLDGTIRFWGKANSYGEEKPSAGEPLVLIPADHWRYYQIESGSAVNAVNNSTVATYDFKRRDSWLRNGFLDVHIHEPEAVNWMNSTAENHRGRRDAERQR